MKFKVGDRVVVTNDTSVADGFYFSAFGVMVQDDPPVGAPGTVWETKHHPMYGVLMDQDLPHKQPLIDAGYKPPLSGYMENELEHYREEKSGRQSVTS